MNEAIIQLGSLIEGQLRANFRGNMHLLHITNSEGSSDIVAFELYLNNKYFGAVLVTTALIEQLSSPMALAGEIARDFQQMVEGGVVAD